MSRLGRGAGRRRLGLRVLWTLVILAGASCGGTQPVPAPSESFLLTMTLALPAGSGGSPSALQPIVAGRLQAYGVDAVTVVAGARLEVRVRDLGEADVDTLETLITAPGRFELREVLQIRAAGSPGSASSTPTCAETEATSEDCSPSGLAARRVVFEGKDGARYELGPTLFDNSDLASAEVVDEPFGSGNGDVAVGFEFAPEATTHFAEETRRLRGKEVAICVDRSVLSAPTIEEPILHGEGRISGIPEAEVRILAAMLDSDPLPDGIRVVRRD